jgi:pimeloyl-ACP methyl ester carboxylesterase
MKTHFPDVTEYHRLEGVGHACFYEKPDEVNRLILNFVQRIEAAEGRLG